MPERGMVGVFNRSHYEDLIGARVHDSLKDYPLPESIKNDSNLWNKRYRHFRHFENYLADNGFYILKIFLNVSKEVQKERLLDRMENPDRNWEFSFSDLKDRQDWDEYMTVFKDTLQHTSTEAAPWFIIPADDGEEARYLISEIFLQKLNELNPQFPKFTGEEKEKLEEEIENLKNGKYD